MHETTHQERYTPIKLAMVLLFSAGLSACGGGGSSEVASSSNAQTSTQSTSSDEPQARASTVAAPTAGDQAAAGMTTAGGVQAGNVPAVPADYVRCAGEAQDTNCQFTGNATMYYGVPGAFAVGNVQGPFNCNSGNAVFGDPIFGTVKSCYVPQSVLTPISNPGGGGSATATSVPAGYTRCAGEAQDPICQFSGSAAMYYGAPGAYAVRTVQGPFNCSTGNSVFGDPAYGVVKSCFVPQTAIAGTPPVTPPITPPPAAAPPVAPAPPPVTNNSSAQIASVELAQSILVPSTDTSLPLVANKPVLVKVNVVTGNPQQAKPAATLVVQNSAGQVLQQIAMTAPTGPLPGAVPRVPSFADSYTAVVPPVFVGSGLRLTANLSNGQTSSVAPRVAGGLNVRLVAVPVQIGGAVGVVPAQADSYLLARTPVSSVALQVHAPYYSRTVGNIPGNENAWGAAYSLLLEEINNLRYLEQASNQSYYFGFLPKRSYGLAGLGYLPGNAAVGFDIPDNPDVVRQVMTHEIGHNFNLEHAPCGGPQDADPQFPYANAALGGGGRNLWGYNFATNTFVDPTDPARHDIMSYCSGDTFSDYNYRLMQNYLIASNGLAKPAMVNANANTGPQELLLVSGKISGDKAELSPSKSLLGVPQLPKEGAYTLRVVTAQGTLEYRFAPQKLDHNGATDHFAFTIPHPGVIGSMSVVKGAASLVQTQAPAVSMVRVLSAASEKPQVQVVEKAGVLSLTWDNAKYPYLTVTHVGALRTALAQDLSGGAATVQAKDVPAAGQFEFSLSDGLNTARVMQAR
jgi:hypothetical protein